MTETLHPWDRQPKEPARWFDRFTRFCQMGSGRALATLYAADWVAKGRDGAPGRTPPRTWRDACERWDWRSRAEAYDQEQRRLDAEALASARNELRETERAIAARLRERAQTMLDWPLAETLTADGLTVVKPARWAKSDVARYLKLADELDRLALGMETSKLDLRVEDLDRAIERELANLAGSGESPTAGTAGEGPTKTGN